MGVPRALYGRWREAAVSQKVSGKMAKTTTRKDTDEIAPRKFKQEVLTIRITKEGMDWLREVADRKQVAPSTLARMWILENLAREGEPKGGPWV